MSKAFGLANIRFGYLLASEENINYISGIRNPKNITTFAQESVIGALLDINHMKEFVDRVNEAKDKFIKGINELPSNRFHAYESSANFVLIRCEDQLTKSELLNHLERNNVFIRNVSQSESVKNCVRITIGNSEQMSLVLDLFKEYIDSTK